tara:strand:- start:134 stop:910 length:777 start_codon:yes stop_codon:yes gene_type:complete
MGKYFLQEVKPLFRHTTVNGNITNASILFDWHAFDIPKGAAKLIGLTIRAAGKDGADWMTNQDIEFFYAKSYLGAAPTTLGGDGAVDTFGHWFHQIIGKQYVSVLAGGANDGDLVKGQIISVGRMGGGKADKTSNDNSDMDTALVLQGEPDSGINVGYDRLYIAGLSKATWNITSTMIVGSGGTAINTPIVTVATIDATVALNPGDVLKDEDGLLLGTVKNVDSATQITLEENCANVSAAGKVVRNVTPLTLLMSFEK